MISTTTTTTKPAWCILDGWSAESVAIELHSLAEDLGSNFALSALPPQVFHFDYFSLPLTAHRSFHVIAPATVVVDAGTSLQAFRLTALKSKCSDCGDSIYQSKSNASGGKTTADSPAEISEGGVMVGACEARQRPEAVSRCEGLISVQLDHLGPLFDYERFFGHLIGKSKVSQCLDA